ncbi:uncharacterized protein BKA78DRAFT_192170 [Phyllosticta capitalensis]|uniref:uncharacterized protein n=1 Tax=Phyllosticta capitalensis TaxID=121624 RepID=UPI00312CE8DF
MDQPMDFTTILPKDRCLTLHLLAAMQQNADSPIVLLDLRPMCRRHVDSRCPDRYFTVYAGIANSTWGAQCSPPRVTDPGRRQREPRRGPSNNRLPENLEILLQDSTGTPSVVACTQGAVEQSNIMDLASTGGPEAPSVVAGQQGAFDQPETPGTQTLAVVPKCDCTSVSSLSRLTSLLCSTVKMWHLAFFATGFG